MRRQDAAFSSLGCASAESVLGVCAARAAAEGRALRPRFSPGYGDLAIDAQKDIFALLDCERQIGLTLGDSLLMSPGKSVTAFAGIPRAADIQNGVTR